MVAFISPSGSGIRPLNSRRSFSAPHFLGFHSRFDPGFCPDSRSDTILLSPTQKAGDPCYFREIVAFYTTRSQMVASGFGRALDLPTLVRIQAPQAILLAIFQAVSGA